MRISMYVQILKCSEVKVPRTCPFTQSVQPHIETLILHLPNPPNAGQDFGCFGSSRDRRGLRLSPTTEGKPTEGHRRNNFLHKFKRTPVPRSSVKSYTLCPRTISLLAFMSFVPTVNLSSPPPILRHPT